MDRKKVLQNVFTAMNVAEQVMAAKEEGRSPLNASVALSAFFSRRFSSPESFKGSLDGLVYLSRKDFPELREREIVTFRSGNHRLKGYLYRAPIAKGLILYVHGLMGCADDKYAIAQAYFLRKGYDVFAIDLTASGASEGMGVPGLHQSALDVAAAEEYLCSRADLAGLPLYRFGHSWGGYGVSAALNLSTKARAVAELSGFDTPLKEMLALPKEKIGMDVDFGRDELAEALQARCGDLYDLSASKGIYAHPEVRVLLAHGEEDHTVPMKGASIYDNVAEGTVNVTKVGLPRTGHMDIFFSPESRAYASMVMAMGKEMIARYGKKLSDVPPRAIEEFQSSFNPAMTSVPNAELFDRIDAFYGGGYLP